MEETKKRHIDLDHIALERGLLQMLLERCEMILSLGEQAGALKQALDAATAEIALLKGEPKKGK